VISASTGWKGRAALRGSTVAALLFLLTGCSAPTAPPSAVAEQPDRAAQPAETAPTHTPQTQPTQTQPTQTQPTPTLPEVPIRSAAVDDLVREDAAPPVRVDIPSLDIGLPVQPVGVQEDGWMAVPEDPSVVGWYRFGPAPASTKGATVLAAHVDSLRYGLGPFSRLKELQAGAEVLVTEEGGAIRTYRVEEVRRTGKGDLVDAGVFDRTGAPRLHLITCGGSFDQESRTYSDNVIVTAIPVP
jgi:sortase (surface protein transpeptidase)